MTRLFSGTVSVTNGSTMAAITAGGPLTSANCPDDAAVSINGIGYHVASLTDTINFELSRAFAEADGEYPIEIDPMTPATITVANLARLAANVQYQLNILDKNSQGLFYTRIGVTGDADPGPGNLAFNNADPVAVTELYVDNVDANNRSVPGLLDLWTSSTILLIRSLATTAYVAVKLGANAAPQGGYYRVSVQHVDHDGVLADGEAVSVGWFRVGEGLQIDAAGPVADLSDFDDAEAGFIYLSSDGNTATTPPSSALHFKTSSASGDWAEPAPLQGPPGFNGWAPRFGVVADGARRVMQLTGYVGGTGTAPTDDIGKYLATGGYTATIGDATDIRGATGATGAPGTNGTNGVDGIDGTDPGIWMTWSETTTDADPGSGVMRADNADLSAATMLFVSKANRAGDDVSAWLAHLVDSTNPTRKGTLTISRTGGNAQATFDLTALTDATGYVKLAVSNGSGATGFFTNDLVSVQFSAAGDQGQSGDGTGDVIGPDGANNNAVVTFDGTTGKLIKDGGALISDFPTKANNLSDLASLQVAFDNLSLKGANKASAATLDLDTATGSLLDVTGTTTTTAITLAEGRQRMVRATGAWPITVGANLILNNGGANYTCAAGDMILFRGYGSGVVRGVIFPISGRSPQPPADFTGDSGAGGAKGLVPAPAAGDAAANKFLKADGSWAALSVGDLEATVALVSLQVSDNSNAALILGLAGNQIADSFKDTTFVDVGGATGLDDSVPGLLKPTIAGGFISPSGKTKLGNMTGGGGLAAAFDGVTSQGFAAGASLNPSASGFANTLGIDWGVGVTKTVNRFRVYGPNDLNILGGGGGTTLKLQGSTDNFASSIVDLTSSLSFPTGTSQSLDVTAGITTTTAYRYHRVIFTGNNTNAIYVAEVQFYEATTTSNLSVSSSTFTAAVAPTKMKAFIRVKEVDAAVAGTDYTLECSRDGGATWSVMTLTELFTSASPTAGIRVVQAAETDVSGQPSGTAPRWRFKTSGNKMIELHDVYFSWR
ncbi:Flagellar hook-length control protein FliK [Devosia sp. H5989]|nr:Flagellar hook-length control protein FliK [Devosia sp. H5989]